MRSFIVALSALVLSAGIVEAKPRTHHRPFHHHYSRHHYQHHARRYHYRHGARYASHTNSGRPHAWCGWQMRMWMGVSDTAYNLARNWAHWGHATSPHIGAVVVWAHHVGKIVGGSPGRWEVLSGNDGHRVRTRVRSIAGAIAFRD